MPRCGTCSSLFVAGSLFCDSCGAPATQVKVARKLRQTSFDTIKDAKEGLLAPGERIKGRKHYIIEESVARSGFGATFRALQEKEKKQVLIKQMLEQSSYDGFKTQLLKSFKREAKFLMKIKHPAFPRGFEYFEKNKSFYLIMEFINGKDLSKALSDYKEQNKGKIEEGMLVHLGVEIADALEVIHSHGYIYRDLKPQNVMLDGISSRVKLIDFGTLYHKSDTDPLIFESEGYTPPEFRSKDKPFQPSGDVYSLGALLYEAITGELPKVGGKLPGGKVDNRIKAIIDKCLEAEPEKRYQKSREVRDEFKKLTRGGFWPFKRGNTIAPKEISILPKSLYPSTCTFCEFCGYADQNSQVGYCPKCRVALKVGRLTWKIGKDEREFFLYSDQTIIGSATHCQFSLAQHPQAKEVRAEHARIFRRKNGLWLEAVDKNSETTFLNLRKIIGPVELKEGDTITIGPISLHFSIKDAC